MCLTNNILAIKLGKLILRTCCAFCLRVLCTSFVQSNQTLFKLDVKCLAIKCFAMSRTSDAEFFTLCVMFNVDGIVRRVTVGSD